MNQVISSKLSSSPSATVSARLTQRKGPSTVVSHPAQLGSPPLVACITACNESPEELQFCLETFHGESPVDLDLDAIYVILDGCPDEDMQANNQTFQALVSIMGLQVPSGGAGASILEGGCRVYVGEVGSIPARLYVKGHGEFQRSKRRSIMAFYDVLGERIASGTCEEPMAVLHMDADTGSSEPGRSNSMTSFGLENVARLLRIMRNDDNLGALATQVRVLHRTKNTLALMQSFDCNSTYVGINGGTGLIGRSTACLGMTVMYRYSTLYASHVEGVLSPMAAFSRIADHNIVDHVNLDMNEDQGMTTFIMRAGYDTRTSLITRFCTFAPENIAELLGQRRRWQVGFLVGLPYQMFGSPSPHLQLSKARWLTALFLTNVYVNVLVMPGTLGFGLAFLFEQAFIGVVQLLRDISSDTADCDGIYVGIDTTHITTGPFDNGGRTECAGSAMIDSDEAGSFARQAMFAACTWSFWLAFVAATIGRAPKEVHVRCQFFFTAASVVTVAIIVTAALVSRAGQAFLGILLGSNAVVGLLLTSNIREWPHRLQELLPYCLFLCAVKPMITLYAVANVDSALWGTRSVGDVKNTSEDDASSTTSVSETDSDSDSAEDTMMRPLAVSRGHWANARVTSATVRATIAQGAVEEKAIPLTCADTEDLAIHVDEAQNALTNGSLREKSGGGEERGARKANAAGLLSLRSWKFVLLVPWVLLNVIVTVVYVQWSIPTFAALGFFGNVTGQTLFVVAAWLEMRRQRRAAMRSPPPSVFADSPAVGSASLTAPSV